jgi:hypothetical protein
LYPEKFEVEIFMITTSYEGDLFYDKIFIKWSVEDVKEINLRLTEEK